MSNIIFITGATSGFGKACALKFAAHGYDLILNGRRKDRLDDLQTSIQNKFNIAVCTMAFDVQSQEEVFSAINSISGEWQNIDVLINNAGLALGRDYFEEANLDDWNTMLDTNVKGLVYTTKALLPFMIKRKQGQIINIGSVAGKEVYEKGNMYCASKFAVDALSQSMRIDLLRHNIKVTSIHPGAAETEFGMVRFKGDEKTARSVYDGLTPLSAEDIADVIYYCTTLPPHVCINDLVITCTQQAGTHYFHRNKN